MTALFTIAPTELQLDGLLGLFLKAILPTGVEVVRGQVNRVPEPQSPDFVVFWPTLKPRLGTNRDEYLDCVFTGGITGSTLTVTAVDQGFPGRPGAGSPVFGVGIQAGVTIVRQLTGPAGGAGTYQLSAGVAPPIAPGTVMAGGTELLTQPSEMQYQLDVHGPAGGDNTAVITTIFRDARGVDLLAAAGVTLSPPLLTPVTPLYCDLPRQVPFTNDQDQWEERYVIVAHLQVDQYLSLPQQFADQIEVQLTDLDNTPPE